MATETEIEGASTETADRPGGKAFNTMASKLTSLMGEVTAQNPNPEAPPSAAPVEPKPPTKPATESAKAADAPKVDSDKKADAPADLPDESTKGLSPKAAERFEGIKKSRDEFKVKLESTEKLIKDKDAEILRLKQSVPDTQSSEEVTKLKAELAKYQDELKIANVERDPRFKAYFDGETNKVLEYIKQRVDPAVADKVIEALKLPEGEYRKEKLRDLVSDMDDFQKNALLKAESDLWNLNREKQAEIAKGPKLYDELQQRDKAMTEKQKAEQKARRESVTAVVLQNASAFEAFKPVDGDEAHNSNVENNKAFVRKFLGGEITDEKVISWMPVLAAEANHLRENVLPKMREENAKLKEQLASYQAASPKAKDAKPSQTANSAAPEKPKNFADAFKRAMAGVQ